MTQELKDEALEHIDEEVKFGFDTREEIYERTLDLFYDERDIDKEWIIQQINLVYSIQQEKSKQWPKPTDFDKLVNAFDELIRDKIICLHKAGNTKSEGRSDCLEVIDMLKEKGIMVTGYCFYHVQDLQRAISPDSGNLFLGFDSIEENDEAAVATGNKIEQVLKKHGFEINWPGTVTQRIEIANINWQKVPDRQNWGLTRPVEILSQKAPVPKPWWKIS